MVAASNGAPVSQAQAEDKARQLRIADEIVERDTEMTVLPD